MGVILIDRGNRTNRNYHTVVSSAPRQQLDSNSTTV